MAGDTGGASLRRELGIPSLFSIATGAMISSGLFVLPALAYSVAGPGIVFSYLIAGLLTIPTVLSKAELATAMPRAGGTYYFIGRALGPLPGTISGLAAWFSLTVKTAFAFVGLKVFSSILLPSVDGTMVAIAACALFTALNLQSAGHAGMAQTAMVGGLILILLAFGGFGITAFEPARLRPFAPGGFSGILQGAALVFVSFGGLTKVASVSEEVRNPGRSIPAAMFLALGVVTLLYFSSVLVTVGTLDPEGFATSSMPLSDAARSFAGEPGFILLTVAALVAFLTTANAGILASARFPLAMSRDRLIPDCFARVSPGRGTPRVSIVATSCVIILLLLMELIQLVKLASALMIFLYLLENLVVVVMRESRIHTYKPLFRSPGYPWVQIFGVTAMLLLLAELGWSAFFACILVTVGGAGWYFLYSRKRTQKHYALLHLAARIFPRQLKRDGLIRELADVLRERDSITEDRFDRLVGEAAILDIEGVMGMAEFFERVSLELESRLGIDAQEIVRLLTERECDSSTALRPGLAIPHIIVPGENRFSILLARCRKGIEFGGENSPVRMVFVLAGTTDERDFHLRALMAIAEISNGTDIDTRWMKCRDEREIRDLVLLSKRRREPSA